MEDERLIKKVSTEIEAFGGTLRYSFPDCVWVVRCKACLDVIWARRDLKKLEEEIVEVCEALREHCDKYGCY